MCFNTLALPYPEESVNTAQTVANTDVAAVMTKWLTLRGVPYANWDYFKNTIIINIYDSWPPDKLAMGITPKTPAATWQDGDRRHLDCLAKWLNVGVIAHEQAHNSYALLTEAQKLAFTMDYTPLITANPYIKLLYSKNKYGLASPVEGHAEVYRYICYKMPDFLKQYYPRLF